MNKLKIGGIILSIVAAIVFVICYFGRPHTVGDAIMTLIAGGFVVIGLLIVATAEEIEWEDTKDEK